MTLLEGIIVTIVGLIGLFLGYNARRIRPGDAKARYEFEVGTKTAIKQLGDSYSKPIEAAKEAQQVARDPAVDITDTLGKLIDEGRIDP